MNCMRMQTQDGRCKCSCWGLQARQAAAECHAHESARICCDFWAEVVQAEQAVPQGSILLKCNGLKLCTWAVQAGQAVPEVLRTLALRALAVQLMDRTRHSSVIAAISIGGQRGLLSQLMHSAVRP